MNTTLLICAITVFVAMALLNWIAYRQKRKDKY